MKYLGLDYGRARTGVAVSDDEGTLAFPRTVLYSLPEERLFKSLAEIIETEKARVIVVGLPSAGEGIDPNWKKEVEAFAHRLEVKLQIQVIWENEMFTTKIAEIHSKKKSDASAAALILQSFLDRQNRI